MSTGQIFAYNCYIHACPQTPQVWPRPTFPILCATIPFHSTYPFFFPTWKFLVFSQTSIPLGQCQSLILECPYLILSLYVLLIFQGRPRTNPTSCLKPFKFPAQMDHYLFGLLQGNLQRFIIPLKCLLIKFWIDIYLLSLLHSVVALAALAGSSVTCLENWYIPSAQSAAHHRRSGTSVI